MPWIAEPGICCRPRPIEAQEAPICFLRAHAVGMETNPPEKLLPAETVARRVGVPVAWLKREAREGRIPFLKAGRGRLFNERAVCAALAQRAAGDLAEGGAA